MVVASSSGAGHCPLPTFSEVGAGFDHDDAGSGVDVSCGDDRAGGAASDHDHVGPDWVAGQVRHSVKNRTSRRAMLPSGSRVGLKIARSMPLARPVASAVCTMVVSCAQLSPSGLR